MHSAQLTEALQLLGEVLKERGLCFEIIVIGGGALLLHNLIERPTMDLDAVAQLQQGKWTKAKPLPPALVEAIRDVARALDLPSEPRDERDWLNGGPASLHAMGLPDGFVDRTEPRHFGPLTVRLAHRRDLICLKMWSASSSDRGNQRVIDVDDLRALAPTVGEIREAVRWCQIKDGRIDFVELELLPILEQIGFSLSDIDDE